MEPQSGEPETEPAPPELVELERGVRLSESALWRLARTFYEREGVDAWGNGQVPHWVTTNPWIARAYARLVHAYLRDAHAQGEVDPSRPVYLVELGSGSGRFARAFLRAFLPLLDAPPLRGLSFTYVMTDLSQRTVDAWSTHPRLRPLIEDGRLDFARLDLQDCAAPTLLESGVTLAADALPNPTIVVANYLLDSLPPDCFTVEAGQLHESLLTASVPAGVPEQDVAYLEGLSVEWTPRRLVDDGGYYREPDLDAVLAAYGDRLGDTTFLFPVTALRCLRFFHELAGGRLLLLSGDNGNAQVDDLLGAAAPGFALHGAVSCLVNYHAIGEYVRRLGGVALHPRHEPWHLTVAAYVMAEDASAYAETEREYAAAVAEGGPDDWFAVKQALERHVDRLALDEALAYLRLSGWDDRVFFELFPRLLVLVEEAPETLKPDVHRAALQVWDAHYELGDGADLPFCLGILLSGISYHVEATVFFERSLERNGADPTTVYALAATRYALRDVDGALAWALRALELDPAFAPAKDLRLRIETQRERVGSPAG